MIISFGTSWPEIYFKRPARKALYADFCFDPRELDNIRKMVREQKEIDIVKKRKLTDKQKNRIL